MNYKRFHTQTGSGKIIEASSMIVYLEQKDTTIYFLGENIMLVENHSLRYHSLHNVPGDSYW